MLSFKLKTVSFTFPGVLPHVDLTLAIGFLGGNKCYCPDHLNLIMSKYTKPFIRNLFIKGPNKKVPLGFYLSQPLVPRKDSSQDIILVSCGVDVVGDRWKVKDSPRAVTWISFKGF